MFRNAGKPFLTACPASPRFIPHSSTNPLEPMKDLIIIGAGAIGSAAARTLAQYELDILVLEKESDVGEVTSSANSAIVHSGYDPVPGSEKAAMNVRGNLLYDQMCEELDIDMRKIGSLTIATNDEEVEILRGLEERGRQNGVPVQMLSREETLALEPNLTPEVKLALLAPTAGIVNTFELCVALMENAMDNGVKLNLNEAVTGIRAIEGGYEVTTNRAVYQTRAVVNAAGLFSDEINNFVNPVKYEIQPRKGEYFVLDHFDPDFIRHTIFTVPSSKGKGILVSPTTHGNYILGPSAEFVEEKDDYSTDGETLAQVLATAKKLVPSIPMNQVIREFSGLRAVEKSGHFIIEESLPGFVNLVGIQSPGLTSCPAIAEEVVKFLSNTMEMKKKEDFNPRRRPMVRLNRMTPEERAEFVKKNPKFGNIICRCEMVSEGEVLDCIHRNCGAATIRGVKRRVRPGMGKCQGGFCQPRIIKILARELGIKNEDVRMKSPGSFILMGETK
ncbi:MAG: NAD(P)/FAD-dependent oxidoreductase [Planctomycetaceae bacterium]|nr:NAD(P)/FAD-dependent oxidoreductase [Planctomycetaceae bacterium]